MKMSSIRVEKLIIKIGSDHVICRNCVGQAGKYAKYFKSGFYTLVIETNGTAVVVVSVTGKAIRLKVPIASKE
jgi:hypothetical protein